MLEVMPDHFFADPAPLEALADDFEVVLHDVGMSLGSGRARLDDIDHARLARLRAVVAMVHPAIVSDHLAVTRGAELEVGHLAPVWYTTESLAIVVDRVNAWQDAIGCELALENIASPFVIPESDMDEPEFFHRLVDATGCRLLLDLSNLLFNARNFGFDPRQRLDEYPLEAVVQVHLAGGEPCAGFWVDSHANPVEDASFELLSALRSKAPVRAIVIERDGRLPTLADLVSEARQAERIWKTPC